MDDLLISWLNLRVGLQSSENFKDSPQSNNIATDFNVCVWKLLKAPNFLFFIFMYIKVKMK